MKYHVHLMFYRNGEEWSVATFTLDALDDAHAQSQIHEIFDDFDYDVQEIEEVAA